MSNLNTSHNYKVLLATLLLGTAFLAKTHSQPITNLNLIEDASGLFNERGYLTANSFSLNGNEVINDFNGNLIYTRTLKVIPRSPSEFVSELRISYNGSVGHILNSGLCTNCDPTDEKQVHVNLPEWIISVNNIAIQTFNFENDAVSWESVGDTISNEDDVAALIKGYHTCYSVDDVSSPKRGVVSILMGDGSISQYSSLNELEPLSGPGFMFSGEYRSFSKEDRSRGFLDPNSGDFTLFLENGTKVQFTLHLPNWRTTIPTASVHDQPKMFLPWEFSNQKGNVFNVTYETNVSCDTSGYYGRPLVKSAGGLGFNWNIWGWSNTIYKLELESLGDPEYIIDIRERTGAPTSLSLCDDVNRGYVSKLTDALGRSTTFSYKQYKRSGANFGRHHYLGNINRYTGGAYDLIPERLYTIDYPTGGKVLYSYYKDNYTKWPTPSSGIDSLQVDHGLTCSSETEYPCKKSTEFDNLGRDPYFTNMIVSKTKLSAADSVVLRDSLRLFWTDAAPLSNISFKDEFFSERTVWSGWGEYKITENKSLLSYRQFPERGQFSIQTRDRGWSIKLMEETNYGQRYINDNPTGLLDTSYSTNSWYIDTTSGCPSYCNGIFLAKEKTTIRDGVPYTETYIWDFVFPDSTQPSNNNLYWRSSLNSWGITNITYFNANYMSIVNDTSYYTNSLVDSSVMKKGSTLLAKSANDFYTGADTLGFAGQIARTVNYDILNGSIVDSLEERFVYETSWLGPYNENGALLRTYLPNGDSTLYHYWERIPVPDGFPGAKDDSAYCPVTFYELNWNGTIDTISEEWNVVRGPFWYKAVRFIGLDSLIYNQRIDTRGNPLQIISPDGFSSSITFDVLDRLDRVYLPGIYDRPVDTSDTISQLLSYFPTYDAHYVDKHPDTFYVACPVGPSEDLSIKVVAIGPPPDPRIDRYNPVLSFFGKEIPDYSVIDSAFLHLNISEALDVTTTISCRARYEYPEVVPCTLFSAPASFIVGTIEDTATGPLKLDVTQVVKEWTSNPSAKQVFLLNSSAVGSNGKFSPVENSDSSLRPKLDIYFRAPVLENEFGYSIMNKYTDTVPIQISSLIPPDSNPYARISRITLDDFGRPAKSEAIDTSGLSLTTTRTYDYNDRLRISSDQLGLETDFVYDKQDRTITTTFPDSAASTIRTAHSHSSVQAVGLDTLFSFPDTNLYLTRTYNENGDSTFSYSDVLGRLRLQQQFLADTAVSTYFDYDDLGNLTRVIRPEGDEVHYEYNSFGWLLKEWSADYDPIFYWYDKNGNIVRMADGNLNVGLPNRIYYVYDELNRLLENGLYEPVTGPPPPPIDTIPINKYFYDQYASDNSRGRLSLSLSNENGYDYGEKYDYDARGRLTRQTDYFEAVLDSTTYDSIYVDRFRNFGADTVRFTVQKYGTYYCHLLRDLNNDPDSYIGLFKGTDAQPHTDTIAYLSYPPNYEDTAETNIICDTGDVLTLVANIDGDSLSCSLYGVVSWDEHNIYQKFLTGLDYRIEFTYDLADQLKSVTYPNGMIVTYEYDDFGRLKSVGDTSNPTLYASMTYTARNEIEQMVLGDSLQTLDYAYNARSWLNTINEGTSVVTAPGDLFGEQLFYYGNTDPEVDANYNGNVAAQILSRQNTLSGNAFYYDDLDRLILTDSVQGFHFSKEQFTYDKNGNRQKFIIPSVDSTIYNYTANTNKLASTNFNKASTFTYDANGNITSDSRKNAYFNYDIYNQLNLITLPQALEDDSILYGYSPSGDRIYKSYVRHYKDSCGGGAGANSPLGGGGGIELMMLGGPGGDGGNQAMGPGGPGGPPPRDTLCDFRDSTATLYVRANGTVYADYAYSLAFALKANYIYAGGQRIAMVDLNGEVFFYLNDHLGSARLVIDTAGTVRDQYDYTSFGAPKAQSVSLDQSYRYTGKPYDEDGGIDIYYYGARYYDPDLGRFLAVDPLHMLAPEKSPYTYANNNPLAFIDPDGRWTTSVHNKIIDAVSSGVFWRGEVEVLKSASKFVDRLGNQGRDANSANQHAMRGKNQSILEAIIGTVWFQNDRLNQFVESGDLFALGEALHSVADGMSPEHEGYQEWKGLLHFVDGIKHMTGENTDDFEKRKARVIAVVKAYLTKAVEMREKKLKKEGKFNSVRVRRAAVVRAQKPSWARTGVYGISVREEQN